MSGSTYIPNTVFVDSEVSMDSVSDIIDNGDNPNFVIKARYAQYDTTLYPELHRLDSVSQINDLKTDILKDNESNQQKEEIIKITYNTAANFLCPLRFHFLPIS